MCNHLATYRSKVVHLALNLMAIWLIVTPRVSAQVDTATLVGSVVDATGAALPGAAITVTNMETNLSFKAITDEFGNYTVTPLRPGRYMISAELSGFKKAIRAGVKLEVNQRARVDFVLEVGEIVEAIEVTADVSMVQSESSSLGTVISERPIKELPLNARNFVQLATLVPGVTQGGPGAIGSGARPDDPRPFSSLFVNGVRESSNNFLFDGVDNNDRIHTTIGVRPSVDAIEEFKVQTNLYSAEFGRNAGAIVNVVTKSGSNRFHGSVYEFHRNSALDARNFFDPPGKTPLFIQNQFGWSLGGPIVRDKTFFFVDYEGFRQRKARTFLRTIPTLEMRRGDFRGTGITIFDPSTTRPNPSGPGFIRDPFPDNQIPPERIDQVARRLAALYPVPNRPGLVSNFIFNPVRRQDTDQFDVRIDHRLTEHDDFFARYSFNNTDTINPPSLPGLAGGEQFLFHGPSRLRPQSLVVTETHVFRSDLINQFRFGYNRINLRVLPFFFGRKLAEEFGISGINNDQFSSSMPAFAIAGFGGLGQSRWVPIFKTINTYQFTDSLSYIRGRHSLKFGVQFLRPQQMHMQHDSPRGTFSFSGTFTNNPISRAGTGSAFADFLLGLPSFTLRTAQISPTYLRRLEFSFYVQDDWRATDRLTLNLGLRYELFTPMVDKFNRITNFDFTTGRMLIAGLDTTRTAGVKLDANNFAPRFGFAYSLDRKTVLRGGYGVSYDLVPLWDQLFNFPFNKPFAIATDPFFPQNRLSDGLSVPDFGNVVEEAKRPSGFIRFVPRDIRTPYVQHYNLNLQRELSHDLLLSVAYVGTLGRKLSWLYNDNVPPAGPGPLQARRPFFNIAPGVVGLLGTHNEATSSYHALQLSAERRFSRGLGFLGSYTYSKWIDQANSPGGVGNPGPSPQDLFNRRAERSRSSNDIRHRLVFSYLYELPLGFGKRWLNTGPASHILGGWQISGITVIQSGPPFSVFTFFSRSNTGVGNRMNRIAGGRLPRSRRSVEQYFDASAFELPPLFSFGNAGRNILEGPGSVNFDLSLLKNFRVSEGRRLEFRVEIFNLFNTPQFDLPVSASPSPAFGRIVNTRGEPRELQFALKYEF